MKVLALPEVTEYIENLVPILYEKGISFTRKQPESMSRIYMMI